MDHVTERPRGTAFVHFSEASAVDQVLKDAYKNSKKKDGKKFFSQSEKFIFIVQNNMHSCIELDGRPLIITKAVSREKAANIENMRKNKNQKEDKRNLYLAMEGRKYICFSRHFFAPQNEKKFNPKKCFHVVKNIQTNSL